MVAATESPDVGRLDRLAEVSALRGWKVFRTSDPEAAIGYVCDLGSDRGVTRVVRSDEGVFRSVSLDGPLASRGVEVTLMARAASGSSPESLRRKAAEAGMGITGADYAVAETGSAVVLPRPGLSRLVSLLPPIHVAIVRPEDVVDSLDDIFALRRLAYHRGGGDMGSYLNFITGPSRTADIEQTLVIGVHGPAEAHMVILG